MNAKRIESISPERIERIVLLIRGQKVILDFHLAELYGVSTKAFNQAVTRNRERFPKDFMFQPTRPEFVGILKSQIVTSRLDHGGRRKLPFAFSEQGVAMLSSVLRSPRAVRVNVEIMRAFVRLRQWLASNSELAKRLDDLEKKYDRKFKIVFEAIRQLMSQQGPAKYPERREIGFHTLRETGNAAPIPRKRREVRVRY
ncbi:MAG: DNA-binding protein [Verrucomicrobia bacterium]|nr:MAG: DNA-binding protein [Verrucomicrobiota bacterium]